jgi:hypothetical protein
MQMAAEKVKGTPGKEYLISSGGIDACRQCPFFRSCWNSEEYDRKVDEMGRSGR